MILFNFSKLTFFVIALLHNNVLAPQNSGQGSSSSTPRDMDESKNQPAFFSGSSQESTTLPFKLDKLKLPSRVYNTPANIRIKCKREIAAIFDVNANAEDHVRHAIKFLTINDDNLPGYAYAYYILFNSYLNAENIPTIEVFCREKDNKCVGSLTSIFKAEESQSLTCLISAVYNLNYNIIQKTKDSFVIQYFSEIYENFGFNYQTMYPNEPDFKNPTDYCNSLVQDKESELDLNI